MPDNPFDTGGSGSNPFDNPSSTPASTNAFDSSGGGSNPFDNPTQPQQPAQQAKPKSSSILGRIGGDLMGVVHGVESLPGAAAKTAFNAIREPVGLAIEGGAKAVGAEGVANTVQQNLEDINGHGSTMDQLRRAFPVVGGLATVGQKTGAYAAGVGQAASIDTIGAAGHALGITGKDPLGRGFIDELNTDFTQHPLSTVLTPLAGMSLAGGGLEAAGGALGGAEAGAEAGEGSTVGNALQQAGGALKAPQELLNQGVAAPLRGAASLAEKIPGVAGLQEAAGNAVDQFKATVAARGQAAADMQTARFPLAQAYQTASDLLDDSKFGGLSTAEKQAVILNTQGLMDGTTATGEQAASVFQRMLSNPDTAPLVDQFVQAYNDHISQIAEAKGADPALYQISREALDTASKQRLGLLEPDQGQTLTAAEETMRNLGNAHEAVARTLGASEGSLDRNPNPIYSDADVKTAQGVASMSNGTVEAIRNKAESLGYLSPESPSITDELTNAKQNLSDTLRQAKTEAKTYGEATPATMEMQAKLEDQVQTLKQLQTTSATAEAANIKLANARSISADEIQNAPAVYRPTLQFMGQMADTLRGVMAAASQEGNTTVSDAVSQYVDDLDELRKVSSFKGAEEQPEFTKSGVHEEPQSTLARTRARLGRGGTALQRTSSITATDFREQLANQLEDYRQAIPQNFVKAVLTRGRDISEFPGISEMTPEEQMSAMRDQGYVPWNQGGLIKSATGIDDNTQWIDHTYSKVAQAKFDTLNGGSALANTPVLKQLGQLTRFTYSRFLPFMPAFIAHQAAMASLILSGQDVSMADMLKYSGSALKGLANGDLTDITQADNPSVAEFRQGGQTSTLAKAQNLSRGGAQAVTNFAKAILYLKQLDEGGDPMTAASNAVAAFDHLNNLSDFEANAVRRIIPIYPYLKQTLSMLAQRAIDDPMKMALQATVAKAIGDINPKSNLPFYLQGFDPFRMLTIPPTSLVNPVVRGGLGAVTGVGITGNLTKGTQGTAVGRGFGNVMSPGQMLYYFAHQLPIGRVIEGMPLPSNVRKLTSQIPGIGKSIGQPGGYTRSSTGEIKYSASATNPTPEKSFYKQANPLTQSLFGFNPQGGGLTAKGAKKIASLNNTKAQQTKAVHRASSKLAKRGVY